MQRLVWFHVGVMRRCFQRLIGYELDSDTLHKCFVKWVVLLSFDLGQAFLHV